MRQGNNFGALRLCFAALVIISHAPQQLDGNFSREPLVRLFHTISLGNLAVAGFFIISGYLVTQSFLASASVWAFLLKRVLRLYPAFLCASLLCVLAAAPLISPGILSRPDVPAGALILNALTLTPPGGGQEYAHPPWSMLDVPMWTIAFEARCYLFTAIAGCFGLFRHRLAMLGLTLLLLALRWAMVVFNPACAVLTPVVAALQPVFPDPDMALYLTGLFCTGVTFRLYAGISFSPLLAVACAAGLLVWLGVPALAELGLAVFFPYLIFWLALGLNSPLLARIGGKTDLSYGLYLYAWPISWLIIIHRPGIGPWGLTAVTLVCAAAMAWLSWHLIEQPALALKRHFSWLSGRHSEHGRQAAGWLRPQACATLQPDQRNMMGKP